MTTTPFEARIAKLEDIAAIQDITARYGLSVNKGWLGKSVDPSAISAVFAADAVWCDAARDVTLTGAQAIGVALAASVDTLDLAMHSFTNPVITVDGDTATGQWLIWVAIKAGGAVAQVFQAEDIGYVRTAHGWRIQSIDLHFGAMMP